MVRKKGVIETEEAFFELATYALLISEGAIRKVNADLQENVINAWVVTPVATDFFKRKLRTKLHGVAKIKSAKI